MADSEARQKWDLFLKSLSAWKIFRLTALDGFAAGMRAGGIAMKEKAAQLCEREVRPELDNFNDLNRGWNEALTYAAGAIRAGGQGVGGSGDGK